MGVKNQHMMDYREKIRNIELAKKANMWYSLISRIRSHNKNIILIFQTN